MAMASSKTFNLDFHILDTAKLVNLATNVHHIAEYQVRRLKREESLDPSETFQYIFDDLGEAEEYHVETATILALAQNFHRKYQTALALFGVNSYEEEDPRALRTLREIVTGRAKDLPTMQFFHQILANPARLDEAKAHLRSAIFNLEIVGRHALAGKYGLDKEENWMQRPTTQVKESPTFSVENSDKAKEDEEDKDSETEDELKDVDLHEETDSEWSVVNEADTLCDERDDKMRKSAEMEAQSWGSWLPALPKIPEMPSLADLSSLSELATLPEMPTLPAFRTLSNLAFGRGV